MQNQMQIRFIKFYPVLLFILNLTAKLLFMTKQGLGLDEPFSIYHAQFPFSEIINQLANYNNPPLFEIVLHPWIKMFGLSAFSVRLLPTLFAALCPVALFYFGKSHFSTTVAIGSSLVLSGSTLLNFYAHDCRVYSLFLLLSILSMHFFLLLLNNKRIEPRFILVGSLLIYAHYFGIIVLLIQALFLLLFHREKIRMMIRPFVVITLFFSWHLYALAARFNESVSNGTWVEAPDGISSLYNMIWAFSNEPVVTVVCIALLAFGIVRLLINRNQAKYTPAHKLVLLWFLVPYLGMFLVSFSVPVYLSRYLIFVIPAYYVLLTEIINRLNLSNKVKMTATGVLVALFLLSTRLNPDKKHDPSDAMKMLVLLNNPHTLVVATPKDFLPTLAYYYNINYFQTVKTGSEYHLTDSLLKSDHVYLVNNPGELKEVNFSKFNKVLVFNGGHSSKPLIDTLTKKHRLITRLNFKDSYQIAVLMPGKKP